MDSTAALARVLRIPGTRNLKTDEAREVTVREANRFRYDPSNFIDFAEPDTPPALPTSQIAQPSNGHLDLRSLRVSPCIEYLIQHGDSIGQYPSHSEALFAVILALFGAGYDGRDITRLCLLEPHGISALTREKGQAWLSQELKWARHKANSLARSADALHHQRATDLLAKVFAPRGPLSRACCAKACCCSAARASAASPGSCSTSLYPSPPATASESTSPPPSRNPCSIWLWKMAGHASRQRLRDIQPGIEAADHLHLVYDFPLLSTGGVDKLSRHIERPPYRLIVIDILAMVEPAAKGNSEKGYHDLYHMFTPLQELRRQHPFCLAMPTHLRKAEAEDILRHPARLGGLPGRAGCPVGPGAPAPGRRRGVSTTRTATIRPCMYRSSWTLGIPGS